MAKILAVPKWTIGKEAARKEASMDAKVLYM